MASVLYRPNELGLHVLGLGVYAPPRASIVPLSPLARLDSELTLSTSSGPEGLRGVWGPILLLTYPGYRGGCLRPLQTSYIL